MIVTRGVASTSEVSAVHGNTADERAAASRMVMRAARDLDDMRQLLDALGLGNHTDQRTAEDPDHNLAAYRRGCRCDTCRAANTRAHDAIKYGRTANRGYTGATS